MYDKGLVGTPQFKAAAKYFSQNGFEDADNFIENYNKLKNYYTDDASGPKRFLSDLEAKGLATYKTLEDGNQQWMYSFTDTQEAADAMGMSLESFESMFGRLKDYGDANNFVSSLEEGALKSEEIDDKLIDAQIKMGKLKASGANQSALDDQQAVIDNLIAQKTGITQAISDFKDGTVDRKIQDIKDAKGSIDELNQYIKDNGIDKDSDLGKKYIESIQEQAKKAGIKLTPEFEVDEAAYNKMIQGYEAKAKGQKIKHFQDVNEGIESGNTGDYTDSDVELVNKIKDAQDKKSDNYKQLQDLIQTLNKENPADLAQIQLGNGAYESEDAGIRGAEDALQGFADQLDLTQEQANALLTVLQALGEVKVQPEMSEELKEMQKNKGSVDLAHRPVIDASELSDMGYQNVGDGIEENDTLVNRSLQLGEKNKYRPKENQFGTLYGDNYSFKMGVMRNPCRNKNVVPELKNGILRYDPTYTPYLDNGILKFSMNYTADIKNGIIIPNDSDYLTSNNIRIINAWLTSPQYPRLLKFIGDDYFSEEIEFFATITEVSTEHASLPYELTYTVRL